MAQSCTICRHRKRTEIETEMLQATPVRHIASLYRLSTAAIQRHRKSHLPSELRAAHEASGLERGKSLLAGITTAEERSETLYAAAIDILNRAQKSDPKLAIAAIKAAVPLLAESREFLRLRGEVSGELGPKVGESPSVAIAKAVIVMPRSSDLIGRQGWPPRESSTAVEPADSPEDTRQDPF